MKPFGFEEKRRVRRAVCPICGREFVCTSARRKYCLSRECAAARYARKLERKKAARHRVRR